MNEDAVGATKIAAWVIDGATGVSDAPPLVAGVTDAAWLARLLNDKLSAAFRSEVADPMLALTGIEAEIQSAFATLKSRELTAGEQPTAAFALAASVGDTVHFIGIGDCRIVFETDRGDVGEFNPSDVGAAEALIIAER